MVCISSHFHVSFHHSHSTTANCDGIRGLSTQGVAIRRSKCVYVAPTRSTYQLLFCDCYGSHFWGSSIETECAAADQHLVEVPRIARDCASNDWTLGWNTWLFDSSIHLSNQKPRCACRSASMQHVARISSNRPVHRQCGRGVQTRPDPHVPRTY